MRFIILAILILLPLTSIAADIHCYSNGKLIYSGIGYHPEYMDGIFSWEETKNKKIVFVSADCIVKI